MSKRGKKKPGVPIVRKRIDVIEARAVGREDDPFEAAGDDYYEPYFCDQIKEMAEDMKFPEEWAAAFGVSETTMFGWIPRFPEFARAYSVAATKLRAAFTAQLRRNMLLPSSLQSSTLAVLIAKKRFADLYGDVDLPPGDHPVRTARDVTPLTDAEDTIEGVALPVEVSDTGALQEELELLRRRATTR